jgi:hypothetical protein
MRVHLICQLHVFLGSLASARINAINCGFPKNAVRKSAICFVSVSGAGVGKSTDVSGVPQYAH